MGQTNLGPGSHIFVLHSGSLRDLVSIEPLLTALSVRYPSSTITLACREELVGVLPLFARPPREVVPISFDPAGATAPTAALTTHLNDLDALIGKRWVELFVSADRQSGWFTWFLAAKVRARQAVMAPPTAAPRGLLRVLLAEHGLPEVNFEGPSLPASPVPEPERMGHLARYAGAEPADSPRWRLPLGYDGLVISALADLGLKPGGYLACLPFDDSGSSSATVLRRGWPVERFWSAMLHLSAISDLPLLVIAPETLADHARALASCIDGSRLRTWLAAPADIVLQAGLLASARAYFGTHSGAVELAQAFGVPGVALHGGGDAWPAYAPWAAGSLAMVNPLPCFDCGWDCPFPQPLCLDAISADAAVERLRAVMAAPPGAPRVEILWNEPAQAPRELPILHARHQSARRQDRDDRDLQLEAAHIAPVPRRLSALGFLRRAVVRQ
jgi:hypothetical protein